MKFDTALFLVFPLLLFMCSQDHKDKIPDCKPQPGHFPFSETLPCYDSSVSFDIAFYESGKVIIKNSSDTTLLYIQGEYTYQMSSSAFPVNISGSYHDPPSYMCLTEYDISGTINITDMADSSCIGKKLTFYYRRVPAESEFTLTGKCFACDMFGF